MGLLGLTAYMVEVRSVRWVYGKCWAPVYQSVTALLAKEFVKLVVVAVIVASPLAWLFYEFLFAIQLQNKH